MTSKEKVLEVVERYIKKIETLKEQERVTFEEIKELNTQLVQLENKKMNLYDGETIDVTSLSKLSLNVAKVNEKIKDKKESIKFIRQAVKDLEERYKQEITPLHKELYNEYFKVLRNIGLEVQNIIDQATMKQIEMWDTQKEFNQLVCEINSIGDTGLSYGLPIIEVMSDSVANVLKIVPLSHVDGIKKSGIEHYNNVYGRYGRMIRD